MTSIWMPPKMPTDRLIRGHEAPDSSRFQVVCSSNSGPDSLASPVGGRIQLTFRTNPLFSPPGIQKQLPIDSGMKFPETLEEWASPYWEQVILRCVDNVPWFDKHDRTLMRDFETVLNAYYPTSTERRRHTSLWRPLVRALSGWHYNLRFYHWPVELRVLQRLVHYQRPEISGF